MKKIVLWIWSLLRFRIGGGDKAPIAGTAKVRSSLMPDSHIRGVNLGCAAHSA
jgi:hypothetical protein